MKASTSHMKGNPSENGTEIGHNSHLSSSSSTSSVTISSNIPPTNIIPTSATCTTTTAITIKGTATVTATTTEETEDDSVLVVSSDHNKSPATTTATTDNISLTTSNISSNNCNSSTNINTKRSLISSNSRRSSSISSNLSCDERTSEGGFNNNNISNTSIAEECDDEEEGETTNNYNHHHQLHRQQQQQKKDKEHQHQQQCPPILSTTALAESTKEDLIKAYNQLQTYIIGNENRKLQNNDEINQLKSSIENLQAQQLENVRRENHLVMRLSSKEQELEEYIAQINELKSAVVPTAGVLKTTLVDPAINFIIQKMKKELQETKKKLEDTQNDLVAWKFTPDSNTGKRLMAKCRMLYVENEELGKMINGGRVAKLENDLALQKKFVADLKKSQADMAELIQELDEDFEGMQSTIVYLQQQLREKNSKEDQNQQDQSPSSPSPNNSDCTNDMTTVVGNNDDRKRILVSASELCSQCKVKVNDSDNITNMKKAKLSCF